jgi:hypothetical protein
MKVSALRPFFAITEEEGGREKEREKDVSKRIKP